MHTLEEVAAEFGVDLDESQRLDHRETDYGRAILAGLQSKHVYQGTAAGQRVGRRAANRRAKASRKANRG